MVTVEQLREALGDRAVGKSDAEVLRLGEAVRRLAKAIVEVYASRADADRSCAGDGADTEPLISSGHA